MKILHLEDDPGISRLVAKKLTSEGFSVTQVHDGEDCLKLCVSEDWDILLADYKVPGLDGLQVIRRLSEENKLPLTIMITGAGDEDVAVTAMKLGATDYLKKDLDRFFLTELPAVINRASSIQQLKREKEIAQAALKKTLSELEERIAERTRELRAANTELVKEIEVRGAVEKKIAN